MKHDKATDGMEFAHYRCDDCGELYAFLTEKAWPKLVAGQNHQRFAKHGPGCEGQSFTRISEPERWPKNLHTKEGPCPGH